MQFNQPKTRHSRREVVLGDRTIEILRRYQALQNEERRKAGDSWNEYGLLFTSMNSTPIHFRNLMREFKKLIRVPGLPEIRFHDLHHTTAS